jgi:hypothetical protein
LGIVPLFPMVLVCNRWSFFMPCWESEENKCFCMVWLKWCYPITYIWWTLCFVSFISLHKLGQCNRRRHLRIICYQ